MKTHPTTNAAMNEGDGSAGSVKTWLLGQLQHLRRASADRALRRQLAEMDDVMLRDIGIGEDEIWRVRAQQSFTPRDWN